MNEWDEDLKGERFYFRLIEDYLVRGAGNDAKTGPFVSPLFVFRYRESNEILIYSTRVDLLGFFPVFLSVR